MDYKKIIKSRELRFKILKILEFVPDKIMLSIQYRMKMGRKIDFNNPKRFTEKIQLYKMSYRKDVMHICVDKYLVREYVESKGLGYILNSLYGVYNNIDEIDLDVLPKSFVIKTTNGGGGINIIVCKDKEELDIKKMKETLNKWLKDNNLNAGREWAYLKTTSKIIIEKYLVNDISPESGITDYKFLCFNGNVEYIIVDVDRYIGHKRNFYDRSWNKINVESDCSNFEYEFKKPEGLNEMIKIAQTLSKDFPFVRIDLYYLNKRIIFGEMTFYPWSGYVQFNPDKFDYTLGEKFSLQNS